MQVDSKNANLSGLIDSDYSCYVYSVTQDDRFYRISSYCTDDILGQLYIKFIDILDKLCPQSNKTLMMEKTDLSNMTATASEKNSKKAFMVDKYFRLHQCEPLVAR